MQTRTPSVTHILRVICWIGLVGSACAGAVTAQPASPVVDSLGHRLVEGHAGGAVIGLLRADTTSVYGYGVVDSAGARPGARTVYEIGSITKTFTGLLLAEAVERGTVRLSSAVARFLPDSLDLPWVESGRGTGTQPPITLAHLATHRSGLPRLPSNLDAAKHPTDPYAAYGQRELYSFLEGDALGRTPGAAYEYSNLGMGLLGHVLARRAGTSYGALVRQRITEPLGLADTEVRLSDAQRERAAHGHNRAGAPVSRWHFDVLAGAGTLRSTAEDMLAYLHAHCDALQEAPTSASVLATAMRRAVRPRASTHRPDTRIALGWHITERDGRQLIWHNGGTAGFRSFAGFDRETGRGAVILVSAALAASRIQKGGFDLLVRDLSPPRSSSR